MCGIIVNNSTLDYLGILLDFTIILKQQGLILRRFKMNGEVTRHEVAEMELIKNRLKFWCY